MVFTTLAHHIDVEFLMEAYRRTRKDGAKGVDGQTAADYAEELEANLSSLLDRLKSGSYRAPPVRRVHIPKDGNKTRPIGIPTFEDKILQRAVTMVLEAVYEQDFLDCSHGFRPGRSAHQALDALWTGLTRMRGGWVLDVDLKSFFDTLGHQQLRNFLDQRVRDGVLRRTIGKWLKAGVMEDGHVHRSETGTPQGGVISPLLANIYLHEALDKWFEQVARPRLQGDAFLVRYADDFVIVFEYEHDARRFLRVLPKRLDRFGLIMHPEKTKLVDFRLPPPPGKGDGREPGTFDLLGFTHYWGKSQKGRWAVRRKTAKKRFSRAIKRLAEWCRGNRHLPVKTQHAKLSEKLRGHDAYYGITGNWDALDRLRYQLRRTWRKWLGRRSHKARMDWEKFNRLLRRYPPPPPPGRPTVDRRRARLQPPGAPAWRRPWPRGPGP
ncbi:group II intron reverse transcriptase/maturase [bacterium]|nr:group II intron reverse transcriptase/maturase [bacterium]